MPGRTEIVSSIYGAYRLARLDQAGMTHFNLSVEGFWHSFFAALLVAPGYALLVSERLLEDGDIGLGRFAMVEGVAYLLGWAAFPLAALILTHAMDLGRNYVTLIVAANWAAVIQIAILLAGQIVGFVLPVVLASLILIVITGSVLFYQWFVIRTALQTTGGIALALVVVDLLINIMINLSAERFI
jgi:hypothetical protein